MSKISYSRAAIAKRERAAVAACNMAYIAPRPFLFDIAAVVLAVFVVAFAI